MHTYVCEFMCILQPVCGCVDGSWEADTVQKNHPLATDLFGRWQFQSNSHQASQWSWPPNISITSSSSGLPQLATQERGKVRFIAVNAHMHIRSQVSSLSKYPILSSPKHTTYIILGLSSTIPMFLRYSTG